MDYTTWLILLVGLATAGAVVYYRLKRLEDFRPVVTPFVPPGPLWQAEDGKPEPEPAPTQSVQPYKPLITIGANSEGRVVLTLGDPFGASTTLTCDPASMRKHANQLLAMCDLVEKKEEP